MKNAILNIMIVVLVVAVGVMTLRLTDNLNWGSHGRLAEVDGKFSSIKENYIELFGVEFITSVEVN